MSINKTSHSPKIPFSNTEEKASRKSSSLNDVKFMTGSALECCIPYKLPAPAYNVIPYQVKLQKITSEEG